MKLMVFTDSRVCRDGRSCHLCRAISSGGEQWRASTFRYFERPQACPRGYELPPASTSMQTPPPNASSVDRSNPHNPVPKLPAENDPELVRRRGLCAGCGYNNGLTSYTIICNCRPCGAKRIDLHVCPRNRW